VRLSALTVFRLIIRSNFVTCSTGKSPGLAPLRLAWVNLATVFVNALGMSGVRALVYALRGDWKESSKGPPCAEVPGAAWAVKAIRLIHRQQCPGAFDLDALLP
jgi:hypothetical protein